MYPNRKYVILLLLFLVCLPTAAITFPESAKADNQLVDSVNRTLTLVFCIDQAHYAISPDSIEAVYAWGSMSDYHDAVGTCRMTDFSEDSCFYKTFSYDDIARPGDSGQPEFEFYVRLTGDSIVYYTPDMMKNVDYDQRLLFQNGITPMLIVLPGGPEWMTTNRDELGVRGEQAREIRPFSSYDLTDSVDQHHISNFRCVPGTRKLYRSYHPYYPSTPQKDTEVERLHWVAELAESVGVRSAISLTGDLSYTEGELYICHADTYIVTIPTYYQNLMNSGDVAYVPASATQCYYYTEGASFADYMKQVVSFIVDEQHPMPLQIHCAVGADRTGVICAVLAILCGAEWEDVLADYSETSQMRCQVYRHPNRIRYAISRLTGLDPDNVTVSQLSAAIRHHLVVEFAVLSDAEIDAMVARLRADIETEVEVADGVVPLSGRWDIMGRPVGTGYSGLVIENATKKWNVER